MAINQSTLTTEQHYQHHLGAQMHNPNISIISNEDVLKQALQLC